MASKPGSSKLVPAAEGTRVSVIHLKGSQAFRRWLTKISEETLIPAASITRAALAKWAKDNGQPAPPRR
jgi:hypothetical protein